MTMMMVMLDTGCWMLDAGYWRPENLQEEQKDCQVVEFENPKSV